MSFFSNGLIVFFVILYTRLDWGSVVSSFALLFILTFVKYLSLCSAPYSFKAFETSLEPDFCVSFFNNMNMQPLCADTFYTHPRLI